MCPAPGCKNQMPSRDPNNADYVALGVVVCSENCHKLMYNGGQLELPFYKEGELNELWKSQPPPTTQNQKALAESPQVRWYLWSEREKSYGTQPQDGRQLSQTRPLF